jgi:energy-coupling factor transporter transmembrane protein EcfT
LERDVTTTGPGRVGGLLETAGEGSRRRARNLQLNEIHVVRFVPGTSPLHRMWAGTKLVALGLLSIALLVWPSWKSIGIVGALVLIAFLAARLPRGISPRLPWWLGGVVAAGAVLALVSGGRPEAHLGSLRLGLGGLGNFMRFSMVGVDVLASAALLGWTTPLADLSPALGRLLGPLRHFRVPVDELVGAIALSIRCLPLLLEEARVLRAARRARRPASPRSFKELGDESVEVVFGALANAIRRAREIAEAIEARGGVPTVAPETHPLARVDALALVISAMAVAAMAVLR